MKICGLLLMLKVHSRPALNICTVFEIIDGAQIIFVHPCPEEGSENMRFTANVAKPLPPPASSQGHH